MNWYDRIILYLIAITIGFMVETYLSLTLIIFGMIGLVSQIMMLGYAIKIIKKKKTKSSMEKLLAELDNEDKKK